MSPDAIHQTLARLIWVFTPEMVLGGFACLLFLGGTIASKRHLWGAVALIGLLSAFYVSLHAPEGPSGPELRVAPMFLDSLGVFSRYLAIASGIILLLLSWHELPERQAADHHACLLVLIAGMSLVGSANDLITLFLALELISIPTYIVLYLPRHDQASQEASMKYFFLSIFSSAILLFGFSYLYGIVGSTNLTVIMDALTRNPDHDLPATAAIALVTIVCGLCFRMTAVPFHFYAPDVYQGVANVSAALLAFVPKFAGTIALLRLLGYVLPDGPAGASPTIGVALSDQTPLLFWILATVTMFLGNLLALRQDHVRRMLAYSSIAHAGYMLVALSAAHYLRKTPGSPDGVEAVLFYLVAYGVMTVGAFAVLAKLDSPERRIDTLDDLAGLGKERGVLAITLSIFMFSLIGIPLTAGFTGKFFILFGALAIQEQHAILYRILALLLVINAAIAGWYYLRVVAAIYLRSAIKPFPRYRSLPCVATITACLVLTIGLSVPPGLTWMQEVVRLAAKNIRDTRVAAESMPR